MGRNTEQSSYFAALVALIIILAAGLGAQLAEATAVSTGGSPARFLQARPQAQLQKQVQQEHQQQPQVPGADPVLSLIDESDGHFKAGQKELDLGHVDAAKLEFNRAVNVLLESQYGARTEPRIRDYFDWLVDRISTYEIKALAEGDGFTEKRYETASIDQMLAWWTNSGTPVPKPELKDMVQTDLRQAEHDIAIPSNQRVLSYIELFQGRLHEFIEEGMRRGSRYLPMIQSVFRAEGLPLDLAYVPLVESAFKPNALSRTNAKGVWQFMSGTALENGLRHDWYIDERSDPEKATLAAARYLHTLSNLFNGDWNLALASYNGGPGRLQRAIKQIGVEDFWKLSEKPRLLPRETREYVPMILAAIVIARNPGQYGFDVKAEPPPAYEKITLPRPVDLRRVAEWADTTIDTIQALNPELRRWTTPVKDEQYELKVPAGTARKIMARLQEAPSIDLASLKWYTVKRGETLPLIARKLRVSRADLAEANYLSPASRIAYGERLIVPYEPTVLMAARTDRPVPAAESHPIVGQQAELASAPSTSNRVKITYKVQRGDTLSSIAQLYKTTVAALRTWNPRMPSSLTAGEHLTVFALKTH
jgi:membrane-bound lytic murein transglycosylase D